MSCANARRIAHPPAKPERKLATVASQTICFPQHRSHGIFHELMAYRLPRYCRADRSPRCCRFGFVRATAGPWTQVLGDSLLWLGFGAFSAFLLTSPTSASFSSFVLFP